MKRTFVRVGLVATTILGMVVGLWAQPGAAMVGLGCSPAPLAGVCTVAKTSTLTMKGGPGEPASKMVWKWKGPFTSLLEFGDPEVETENLLCVYWGSTLVAEAYIPPGGSPWSKHIWGFKYLDRQGMSDGITGAKLKGVSNKGTIQVKGKGLYLPVPELPLTGDAITTQLRNGTTPWCWTATYPTTGQKTFLTTKLKAKCGSASNPCGLTLPLGCTLVGGSCWYTNVNGASCDTTCTDRGLACDPATESYAGSGGTDANCQAVLEAFGISDPVVSIDDCGSSGGLGCGWFLSPFRCSSPPTTCGAAGTPRVCACH